MRRKVRAVVIILVLGVILIALLVADRLVPEYSIDSYTINSEEVEPGSKFNGATEAEYETNPSNQIVSTEPSTEGYDLYYVDDEESDLQVLDGFDKSIMTDIEAISPVVFESIGGTGTDYSDITMIGVFMDETMGMRDGNFDAISSFYIENSLTVVGMFGNRYIVMAYNYPENPDKELVVVDFQDVVVYNEKSDLLNLGDIRSCRGARGNYLIREVGDYIVMFLKG